MFSSYNITVIGAGLMGAGIAQVFASKGLQVILYDPFEAARNSVIQRISDNLNAVDQNTDAIARIEVSACVKSALVNADIVFEAVPEKVELKQSIFATCIEHCKADCILASNTSVIPIHKITGDMDFNGRVVGTHWWNPPYLVPLVEVVKSEQTADATIKTMMALLEFVGKKPAYIEKDIAGFVGNRLQHALWREAIALVNDGVCSAETLDMVVKNSFGMRLPVLGPIENADLVGLDLTLDIHNVILPTLNRDTEPSPILKQKTARQQLGVKTNQGFKAWDHASVSKLRQTLSTHLKSVTSKHEV